MAGMRRDKRVSERARMVVLLTVAGVLAAMLVLGGAATAQPAVSTEPDLRAIMTGQQVVNNQCLVAPCADPNGSGLAAVLRKIPGRGTCYTLDVRRIKPATAASIHRGVRGVNGPIVATLNAPTEGSSYGCWPGPIGQELADQLWEHPGRYYVTVSNKPFPSGAIRGQLHR
jgi:hypothetical protein